MDSDYNKIIGQRIKNARLKAGLTQEKLAEAVDLSVQHLSKVENGRKGLTLATATRITNALGITLDLLVHEQSNDMKKVFHAEADCLIDGCTEDQMLMLLKLLRTGMEMLQR